MVDMFHCPLSCCRGFSLMDALLARSIAYFLAILQTETMDSVL